MAFWLACAVAQAAAVDSEYLMAAVVSDLTDSQTMRTQIVETILGLMSPANITTAASWFENTSCPEVSAGATWNVASAAVLFNASCCHITGTVFPNLEKIVSMFFGKMIGATRLFSTGSIEPHIAWFEVLRAVQTISYFKTGNNTGSDAAFVVLSGIQATALGIKGQYRAMLHAVSMLEICQQTHRCVQNGNVTVSTAEWPQYPLDTTPLLLSLCDSQAYHEYVQAIVELWDTQQTT